MFKEFLTALLQKIFIFLKDHPNFFEQNSAEKTSLLEKLTIPETFKNYLEEATEKQFLADLEITVRFIWQPKDKSIKESKFFQFLIEFLNSELAKKIDFLGSEYYLANRKEREEIMHKLIKGESDLAQALKKILVNNTYQQLAENIHYLSHTVKKGKYIVVQSPREISPELKREIREKLYTENSYSFPVFQINKKIIGGIRIFEDGTTKDYSWLSRVLRFTSLTSA